MTSQTSLTNRQIVLRRRPEGLLSDGDTELVTSAAPELAEGEALVRNTYVGIDAAVRTWLDDQRGYLPPVQLGEVVRAAGVGEVVATRCPAYAVGDVVTTLSGFQEFVVVRDDLFTTVIPDVEIGKPAPIATIRPRRRRRLPLRERSRRSHFVPSPHPES